MAIARHVLTLGKGVKFQGYAVIKCAAGMGLSPHSTTTPTPIQTLSTRLHPYVRHAAFIVTDLWVFGYIVVIAFIVSFLFDLD